MAYLVLALGVLMAAVGLYAIVTGYPMIQIERGWATVISGSVVLTGGLVTLALGLAIRTLAEIRAALRTEPERADGANSAMARIEPPPVTQAPLPDHDTLPALAGAIGAATALWPAEPPHKPGRDEPQTLEPDTGRIETPPLPAAEPVTTHAELDHRTADAARNDEPAPDGYELQSPSTTEHDLAPHAPTRSEEEDWLDRALSDFETGLSPTHPAEILTPEHVSNAAEDAAAIQAEIPPIHPEPTVTEPAEAESTTIVPVDSDEARAEPSHAEHPQDRHPQGRHPQGRHPQDRHPEAEPAPPVTAPRLPSVHEPAPQDLAVIGRYESDGTSYIMYADGSIEAQSEAGVYRFRSMAELKTFIEG